MANISLIGHQRKKSFLSTVKFTTISNVSTLLLAIKYLLNLRLYFLWPPKLWCLLVWGGEIHYRFYPVYLVGPGVGVGWVSLTVGYYFWIFAGITNVLACVFDGKTYPISCAKNDDANEVP